MLADRSRRRILDLLRESERAVGDLVAATGLSQPGVSKHLRVLRAAGLVEVRSDGQRRLYRLRPEPLAEIEEWLAPYRAAWRDRLDALERRLDAMPPAPDSGTVPPAPGTVPPAPPTPGTVRPTPGTVPPGPGSGTVPPGPGSGTVPPGPGSSTVPPGPGSGTARPARPDGRDDEES